MMSALGVAILYLGSFIEVLDISMAVLASLICAIIVIEYGGAASFAIWGVTSILSLLLLPQKFPALIYAIFFGYYPIIKEGLERIKSRIVQWVIKLLIFNAAALLLLLASKLFVVEVPEGFAMEIIFFALSNLMLILYDVALTRIISYYIFRLRKRFSKIFK